MKTYIKLLMAVLLISLINGCETTNPDGPDTGDVRDKFLGTWLFTESASSGRGVNSAYTAVITKDPSNSSQVLISNFTGVGTGASAAYGVVTTSSITVPSQSIATDYKVDGSGSLSNSSTMNWSYSVTAGGTKDTYTATAKLQ